MSSIFTNFFLALGIDELLSVYLARGVMLLLLFLISIAVFYVTYSLLLRILKPLARRSETHWDDVLIKHKVIRRLAWLLPAGVFSLLFPLFFSDGIFATWLDTINKIIVLYVVTMISLACFGLINALIEILYEYEFTREIPLNGLGQLLKILLVLIVGILLVATALGENPLVLLSGLGAIAAVLSFIYQDALRGLVAGLQLTSMGLLATGDVVEVPAHGAAGTVTEVGLTTVKIQNADLTVTTVPTAALISGSFKNWQKMLDHGEGRRIKRAVTIDLRSVGFLNEAQRSQLAKFPAVEAYLAHENAPAETTNIGAFRAYLTDMLVNHPQINAELTLMVRYLDPTPHGIPLEIYAFSQERSMVPYEMITADLFDHIIAIAPEFELRLYQAPNSMLPEKELQEKGIVQ